MSARVIQVIETNLTKRGDGSKGTPIRVVKQYWSLDGKLLAEVDPVKEDNKSECQLPRGE